MGQNAPTLGEMIAQVKARVSLKEIMEADGASFRRSGTAFVTCCTIHAEETPSCHLHEKEGGDWFRCFGCGAGGDLISYMKAKHGMSPVEAVKALSVRAGIGKSDWTQPKREKKAQEDEKPVEALDAAGLAKWDKACADLYGDVEEIARIAEWRGFRPQTVEWAARSGLMGRVVVRGVWREAFIVERPCAGGSASEKIGWHVRLAPNTEGNPHGRAIWWYRPVKGLGSWPFVVWPSGGPQAVRHIFITEGQWDALALVDLFRWNEKWPDEVGVVGIRGATTWKRVFRYSINSDSIAYLFGDADDAGCGWFVPKTGEMSFSETLEHSFRRVWSWRPNPKVGKDLNDILKSCGERGREILVSQIRAMTQKRPGRKIKKITFYMWLRSKDSRAKYPEVFAFAKMMKEIRPSTSRKAAWDRFFSRARHEVFQSFRRAYEEWSNV